MINFFGIKSKKDKNILDNQEFSETKWWKEMLRDETIAENEEGEGNDITEQGVEKPTIS